MGSSICVQPFYLTINNMLNGKSRSPEMILYHNYSSNSNFTQKSSFYVNLMFCTHCLPGTHLWLLSCHGKAEECIGLCRALLGVVVWLLQGCAWYCEKLRELGPSASTEASLRACQERLHTLMSSTKNRALVHIARLEEQGVKIVCLCETVRNAQGYRCYILLPVRLWLSPDKAT